MKLSISLSDGDLAVLDAYIEREGLPSRSAGLQRAIRLLRFPTLEEDYAQAWQEWSAEGSDDEWDTTVGDGVGDAAR